MKKVLLFAGVLLLVGLFLVGGFFLRIFQLRTTGHQITEELFSDLRKADFAAADAMLSRDLLDQYPDVAQQLMPTVETIASTQDYKEWYVGGYAIGTEGEKYTYSFRVTYNDGATGKGRVKMVRSIGTSWRVFGVHVTPDAQ